MVKGRTNPTMTEIILMLTFLIVVAPALVTFKLLKELSG